jgi:O-antigen/teichoic acid export membrane protein
MNLPLVGALAFGIVIGWVTYRTLRRRTDTVGLSDIATVIGAVGGAAVTTLFDTDDLFGAYCIGLFVGFFVYLIGAVTILRDVGWLSSD